MADTKKQDEPTLPTKRKIHPLEEEDVNPIKTQKLHSLPKNNGDSHESSEAKPDQNLEKIELQSSNSPSIPQSQQKEVDEEEDDDDDGDYEEEENGGAEEEVVVDRKGKGILIEEDGDDSSDDDDDSNDDEDDFELNDDDSELEDDPLAEVDLDNILPSRTRRGSIQSGVHIRNEPAANNDGGGDSDSDA